MTVKELIERLKEMPEDAEVVVWATYGTEVLEDVRSFEGRVELN